MSDVRPYASVTPPNLIPEDIDILVVRSIVVRIAMIIPRDKEEYRESVLYSNNPKGRPEQLLACTINSRVSEKMVQVLITGIWFPPKVNLIIPRICDIVCNHPIDYFSVYVDHFRAGLCFPLMPLIQELLIHDEITLTQSVPNAIQTIVGFKKLCR